MAIEETFRPTADQVRAARQFVAANVPASVADDAVLLASELVTNAIEHASSPVTVRVEQRPDCCRVEVSDSSAVLPAVGELLNDSERGRGLHLVERITSAWGVQSFDAGKTVWFELESRST
jgi:anti-sigma regulatory factor (Ser/Thr protein kinase)